MQPNFADLGVPAPLVEALAARGMTEAFPVQAATIPDALAGRDVCGRAPTGSGKTIAFGIPALVNAAKAQPGRPTVLILSPTRELADQIRKELTPIGKAAGRWITAVYGGVGYGDQISAIRRGVDVLVACPGRLVDLIDGGNVSLRDVGFVVVDEADRMADMGFLPVVRKLLDQTNEKRQTLLFSATLDGAIAELTARYQNDPARHEVGEVEPDLTTMSHRFWTIRHEDRIAHTRDAVRAAGPTVIFTRTRHGADRLADQLDRVGVSAAAIHGGRSQNQRTRALEDFGRGRVEALVATDVAARGIHVDGVACVIHFDPPEDDKTYLHRSGRTARAGASGVVVSFVRPNNAKDIKTLQSDLGLPTVSTEPDPAALAAETGFVYVPVEQRPQRPRDDRPSRDDRPRREDRSRGNDRPRRDDRPRSGDRARTDDRPRTGDRPWAGRPRTDDRPRTDERPRRDGAAPATDRDRWEDRPRRVDNSGRPVRSGRDDRRPTGDARPTGDGAARRGAAQGPRTDARPAPSKVHRKGGGVKRAARDGAADRPTGSDGSGARR